MGYLTVMAAGYLLGSSNMAYWLSKIKKVDIRSKGTGNLGASNATVLLGWGAGVVVALHDIGKAFLAVLLARWAFPALIFAGAAAGVACVLGHIFPFYLNFRGGKGLASFIGMLAALDWRVALVAAVLLVAITLVTDYIALGTLCVAVVGPLGLWLLGQPWTAAVLLPATGVIFIKHRDNLQRIRNKTEIGLLSTVKGENRVK